MPPPPHVLSACLADFERFLHAEESGLPVLIRSGLAHAQFVTIHPFLDGNGRVGRLLITLQLVQAGVLREPLLYLSLYFKQHRATYYELLNRVRSRGDWETWLGFYLEGVREVADGAVATARRLHEMSQEDRARLAAAGGMANSALRVLEALMARPILNLNAACEATRLTFPTVSAAMNQLVSLGIARELTGKQRNRLFAYDRYLAALREGTE